MRDWREEDFYYRGNDLMEKQNKLLFQNITDKIKEEQWEIAHILSCIEKNSQQHMQREKEREMLLAHKDDPEQIHHIQQKITMIENTQSNLLITLQALFNQVFDQVAEETQGGIGYNKELKGSVWFDLLFGESALSWDIDWARDQYRMTTLSKSNQANHQKNNQQKRKIHIPKNHQLLSKENYSKFKTTLLTHLDNVLAVYQQKFLKDANDSNWIKWLVEHYFLFMFIQTLMQSKCIFDIKKPKPDVFFQELIDDFLLHIQQKHDISLTISSETIKKKFFNTIDETNKPLELLYKNCTEEDLVSREHYFNTYFFSSKNTSVDNIRRQIMEERNQNKEKMNMVWEIMNPIYHLAKDKKEKLLTTIAILKWHTAPNNLIEEVINQLQESLKKTEEDMKKSVVFEEDTMVIKDPDSLVKLQQQYLKRYQVPVQYWKIFGLIINRLNNFYQIKANLFKKAQNNNNNAFNQLINSEQTNKDILYYVNSLISQNDLSLLFDQKWKEKQTMKDQRIRDFSLGIKKIEINTKKKDIPGWQFSLDF